MISILTDYFSWFLLLTGSFLCITGAVGLVRFPDFYTRMHAAGVTDTLTAALLLGGLMLQADSWIVLVKLIFVLLFLLLTSPTASHALAKAAWHTGLKPALAQADKSRG
jgi:multicomponent Na+:H+ antiporter subunit G